MYLKQVENEYVDNVDVINKYIDKHINKHINEEINK